MQTIKIILLLLIITLISHANIPPQTTYNDNNQPLIIEYANGDVVEFDYDSIGRQTQVTYSNGMTTNYTYDSRNRITSIEHKKQYRSQVTMTT
jgi:YD repeat-containing protein